MAGKGTLRVVICGGLMGLTVGLLVVFGMFMSGFLASKAKAPEVTLDQKQRAFMATARDEWANKQMEADDILGRIAVVQARSGDAEGAKQTIEKIQMLNRNIVSSNAVSDYLYSKISPTEQSKETIIAVIGRAKVQANAIADPLFKADALRRVAEYEERVDPEAAKKTLHDAAQAVITAPVAEKPSPFNYWLLLWPAALLVFGLAFAFLAAALVSGFAGAPAKRKTAVEEEEEEDEEEEPGEDVELMGQPPAAVEEPVAPPPPPPAPPAPVRAAAPPAAPPAPTRTAPPAPGAASQPAAAPQPTAAQPTILTAEDKKTMMAKQAQATMLAKQAQATMLAKQAAKPTQIAPPDQAGQ